MYRIHEYVVVILVWYAALAHCKPCGQYAIFNNCCVPSIPVYPANYFHIPPPIPSSLCPVILSCERFNAAESRPCYQQGQCYVTEVWCFNPCYGRPTCQLRTDQHHILPVEKCPVIASCKEYEGNKTKEATECKQDNDCLRKEKCCTNPCENFKTCQEF
ncbi:hypothetical protein CBL_07004 [Carabus blaptoides fortunei]